MIKQFVPYEIAVKLKELDFDEQCLAVYETNNFYNPPEITFLFSLKKDYKNVGNLAVNGRYFYNSFREAEIACINEMIKIVENKKICKP